MKTLVIGASLKSDRFSNKAIRLLRNYNHEVEAVGLMEGLVADVNIKTGKPKFDSIHTVTMYLSASNQNEYMDYIIELNPKRVIFNPGTENFTFYNKLKENNIEYVEHCTLVMLNTGCY